MEALKLYIGRYLGIVQNNKLVHDHNGHYVFPLNTFYSKSTPDIIYCAEKDILIPDFVCIDDILKMQTQTVQFQDATITLCKTKCFEKILSYIIKNTSINITENTKCFCIVQDGYMSNSNLITSTLNNLGIHNVVIIDEDTCLQKIEPNSTVIHSKIDESYSSCIYNLINKKSERQGLSNKYKTTLAQELITCLESKTFSKCCIGENSVPIYLSEVIDECNALIRDTALVISKEAAKQIIFVGNVWKSIIWNNVFYKTSTHKVFTLKEYIKYLLTKWNESTHERKFDSQNLVQVQTNPKLPISISFNQRDSPFVEFIARKESVLPITRTSKLIIKDASVNFFVGESLYADQNKLLCTLSLLENNDKETKLQIESSIDTDFNLEISLSDDKRKNKANFKIKITECEDMATFDFEDTVAESANVIQQQFVEKITRLFDNVTNQLGDTNICSKKRLQIETLHKDITTLYKQVEQGVNTILIKKMDELEQRYKLITQSVFC